MGRYEKVTRPLIKSDSLYDFLNNLVKLFLPALGTFYFTLATIWDLPYAEQVVGTLAALAVLLGVLLFINKKLWEKDPQLGDGQFVINETDPDKDVWSLQMSTPVGQLPNKDYITLKVVNESDPASNQASQ